MKRFTSLLVCLLFIGLQAMMAQDMQVRGTLSDDGGAPLPGVSVVVKGTTIGTATDADGMYELTIPSGATLVFSSVGMKSQEIAVGNQTTIDVVLEADVLGLEEVVVTALGITREKKALGYAVQEVGGDELAKAKETNVVNSLQGKVAGVQITNASGGGISSSSRIIIRGNSSFGNNQPMFVVDGTPLINASTSVSQWNAEDFGNQAMDIDPNHVESISVLKGPSATALYGSRGANGVVLITTKKAKAGKGIGVSFDHSTTFDNPYIFPDYQNSYGQGLSGSEYLYDEYSSDPANPSLSYNEYAVANSFTYLDGDGGGVQDYRDESWGPRLDIGLMIPQFTGNWNGSSYDPSPWNSHPDNVKNFFQTGTTINNSLALDGASARSSARMTLSNSLQKGIIPNTDQTRNNIGISASTNLGSRLKAYVNANYVNTANDNIPGGGYTGNNVMQSIGGWFGRQVDMQALKDNWQTTNPQDHPYNWNYSYHDNPYWTANNKLLARNRNRIYGNVNLDYQITDWLSVLGRIGTDYSHEVRKRTTADGATGELPGGSFWQQTRTYNENNADVILSAAGNVSSDIRLGGSLGANYRKNTYQYTRMTANELTVPDLFTIGNVQGNPSTAMFDEEKVTNSVFGTFNFTFREYLFLDATFRNDWSSTLPKDNWSYFYPSVSLGWIFTETLGMPQNILSFGKLRASWAQVGNDTGPYQIVPTYGADSPFGSVTPFSFTNELPPLDLVPEKTTSFELGGDFRFFMNRLGLDITYYNAITENQIMAVDISTATGFSSIRLNAGEIQNSGLELMLTGKIFQNASGFNWDIMVNYARNRNKVNKLYTDPETGQSLESYQISSSWGSVTVSAIPGEAYGVIKGGAFVKDANGRIEVRSNGTPARSSTPEIIGNTTPDFIGGVNNIFSYKGLTANVLIDFRAGGDIFSVTHWFGAYAGISQATVDGDPYIKPATAGKTIREGGLIVDGVMADGSENTTVVDVQDYFGSYWGLHEPSIIDGSFIKLRELVIGYDIPMNNVPVIEALNVSLVGRNLALLWTHESNDIHIDPETGFGASNGGMGLEQFQVPSVRSLGFKIGLKF